MKTELNEQLQENTLGTLRNQIMHTISGIRNKDIAPQDGIAIAKLGNVVIETYKVEIEAVKTANDLKDKNILYREALTAVPTITIGEQDE